MACGFFFLHRTPDEDDEISVIGTSDEENTSASGDSADDSSPEIHPLVVLYSTTLVCAFASAPKSLPNPVYPAS